MPSFDETRADQDLQQQIAHARAGWMDQASETDEPDLGVEGLRSSVLARIVDLLKGRRN